MRGYTFVDDLDYDDDGKLDLKSQIREEMVKKLAAEWNQINRRIEEHSWRSRDERMDEEDWHQEQSEECGESAVDHALRKDANLTPEQQQEIREKAVEDYWSAKKKDDNQIYLRREVMEELLSDLGARMMRPYEHYNEEERYMEYMETRYDNERDWDY